MTSTPDGPRLTPARLESFSDGVFSIAATLLVLDLRVPDASDNLAAALAAHVMVLMSIAFSVLWRHVTRDGRLLGSHLDPGRARQDSVLFSAGLLAYVLGTGLSFVSAALALAVYGLVALFYVFPWLPEQTSKPRPRWDLHGGMA